MKTEIVFDEKKLRALKRAYEAAKIKEQKVFLFEGNELVIGYAKYLIEYLDSRFAPITRFNSRAW